MEKITLCCTTCPSECVVTVLKQDSIAISVEGNSCKRGKKFVEKEITTPERTLSSTIVVELDGKTVLLPVKSAQPIPIQDILSAMETIKKTKLNRGCQRGEPVIKNICGSGVDIVACKSIKENIHAC